MFATKSVFLISVSLQPNVIDLLYFYTMNSARLNSLRLKYDRLTPSGFEDLGTRQFQFVGRNQFFF